jgi:hypothetical protein
MDDLTAVRAALGHANPQPDPALPHQEVLAARAAVGMARVAPPGTPRLRGRFVAAGAVVALSVATLVAVVVVSPPQGNGTIDLATGPGAKAVNAASAATQAAGTARGLLTVAHGDRTVTATGVGDFRSGDASADIALGERTSPAGTVLVRRTTAGVYVRLPEGLSPLSTDRPWLRIDATDLARLTQLALGDIGAQITGAPLDALAYLRAVSGELVDEGPDLTRGEPTTRYRTTIDPRKIVGQLPQALQLPAGAGEQSLSASLWIDAKGRLRRLEVSADPSASPGAPDGRATVTLELFDFGVPVQVEAPPADEVTDVGGLLGTFLQNATRP